MGFKKHNWIKYGRKGNIIRIEIKENDGENIDYFQVNTQKDYAKIIKIIKDKYGFSPEISPEESTNAKEDNWLGVDDNFKWGEN